MREFCLIIFGFFVLDGDNLKLVNIMEKLQFCTVMTKQIQDNQRISIRNEHYSWKKVVNIIAEVNRKYLFGDSITLGHDWQGNTTSGTHVSHFVCRIDRKMIVVILLSQPFLAKYVQKLRLESNSLGIKVTQLGNFNVIIIISIIPY